VGGGEAAVQSTRGVVLRLERVGGFPFKQVHSLTDLLNCGPSSETARPTVKRVWSSPYDNRVALQRGMLPVANPRAARHASLSACSNRPVAFLIRDSTLHDPPLSHLLRDHRIVAGGHWLVGGRHAAAHDPFRLLCAAAAQLRRQTPHPWRGALPGRRGRGR